MGLYLLGSHELKSEDSSPPIKTSIIGLPHPAVVSYRYATCLHYINSVFTNLVGIKGGLKNVHENDQRPEKDMANAT
jgi:hypothetical protein